MFDRADSHCTEGRLKSLAFALEHGAPRRVVGNDLDWVQPHELEPMKRLEQADSTARPGVPHTAG